MYFPILTTLILIRSVSSLLGYDCENPLSNGTIVSLFELDKCRIPEEKPLHHVAHVELIQRPRRSSVSVIACRVEIENIFSNNDGRNERTEHNERIDRFYLPIRLDSCLKMLTHRRFSILNTTFYSLQPEVVNSRSVPLRVSGRSDEEFKTHVHISFYDNPNLFAYTLTGRIGQTARIRGEAAQLMPCTPVPVRRRPTGNCFREIPVFGPNAPMYLHPRTRVLSTTSTEIPCGDRTSSMFRIREHWYSFCPHPERIPNPETIKTDSVTWGPFPREHDSDRKSSGAPTADNGADEHVKLNFWSRNVVIKIAMILVAVFASTLVIWATRDVATHRIQPNRRAELAYPNAVTEDTYITTTSLPEEPLKSVRNSAECPPRIQTVSSNASDRVRELNTITVRATEATSDQDIRRELTSVNQALNSLEERLDICLQPTRWPFPNTARPSSRRPHPTL
ncbi:hypothetical protein ALC62_00536 [Cyphomyrmex costatus]|uniref:Uncharacterized protein n=1 Tax=Cyphomyrmex costatus TaxID=456900 RepID=A0A151IQV1_9HYME|nr:hypothetical protein ALC62_00536 [Cyphomyrmex costatus]